MAAMIPMCALQILFKVSKFLFAIAQPSFSVHPGTSCTNSKPGSLWAQYFSTTQLHSPHPTSNCLKVGSVSPKLQLLPDHYPTIVNRLLPNTLPSGIISPSILLLLPIAVTTSHILRGFCLSGSLYIPFLIPLLLSTGWIS